MYCSMNDVTIIRQLHRSFNISLLANKALIPTKTQSALPHGHIIHTLILAVWHYTTVKKLPLYSRKGYPVGLSAIVWKHREVTWKV